MNLDTIKIFQSTDAGAPTLQGQVGSITGFLDVILGTGYNSKSVQSIAMSAGVATATYASAHGYVVDQTLLYSGANESVFNDEFRVLSVPSSTTLTFAITGAPASATGTISSKVAALNWTTLYTATNQRAYCSADARSNKPVLSVDNTLFYAKVKMFESVTSPVAGVGGDMSASCNPNGSGVTSSFGMWQASPSSSDSLAKNWVAFGNSRTFYLLVAYGPGSTAARAWYGFGDFKSYKPGDAYNGFLMADITFASVGNYPGNQRPYHNTFTNELPGTINGHIALLRSAWGATPQPAPADKASLNHLTNLSGGTNGMAYPNLMGNAVMQFPAYFREAVGLRGVIPGAHFVYTALPSVEMPTMSSPDLPGRRIGLFGIPYSGTVLYMIGFDMTGPWTLP